MPRYINGVEIVDTFAEAFGMWGARVIITAVNRKWAREAASQDDRFRHFRYRLPLRGRDRSGFGTDSRRQAGSKRFVVCANQGSACSAS